MKFSLPSFAKVNFLLRVLGRRGDGYHELCTVFQSISLHDTLSFEDADELSMTCSDASMPCDEQNLVIKAAKALQTARGETRGAKIHLEKRIPSPGGLGGGSSNAAVTLIGLSKLWEYRIREAELLSIASGLGADVPYFLFGGTALGTGRGDEIEPLEDAPAYPMLVVTPDIAIPTRDIFRLLNAEALTDGPQDHNLSVCRTEAFGLDPAASRLRNDLEDIVLGEFPEAARVRSELLRLGAVNAVLCGSGASVLGIFDKQETRQTAENALEKRSTWRKFAVSAVSRDEYRGSLGL